ncbi:FtsX-like permease family protein [Streptomyces sp. NPDC047024]|uniref:FtsX-like permease family protein n=1 Tax=Streptomyces sp. NPDC047024 TaxID=3155476 RepID=UPI0033E3321E
MSSTARTVAPWVRTRLRAAPGAALALALLVAVTACLAGALPRAVDRYENAGLAHTLHDAGPGRTTIGVFAPLSFDDASVDPAALLRPDRLTRQNGDLLHVVGDLLPVDRPQSSYGVTTTANRVVYDPWLPRPTGDPARVSLVAPSDLAGHASVRAGRLPRTTGPVNAESAGIEAAVTAATARSLHIEVGSVIHVPSLSRAPLAVRVTGILDPREPAGAYWSTTPLLRTPALVPLANSSERKYWLGALLIPQAAAPALMYTGGNPVRYWYFAPELGALRAPGLDGPRSALSSLKDGPGLERARAVTDPETDTDTDLDAVLGSFADLRSGISPLVAVAAAGTATVAVVVLLMAGALAADRRRAELALLRARGVSLPGLAGRLLAETAVAAVPAGAVGLAAALLLLPGDRARYTVAAAAAVTLTACAALPVRAVLAHRTVRTTAPREDVANARPSRRRLVVELTLLVPAAGAVEALRRRGTTGDQLISLAPVLTGVVAALLLLRLYPPLLRLAARPVGRLRGATAQLSVARAGRTSASGVLPLLAVLTALATAAFGGSVLTSVADARDRAALLTIGADARVEAAVSLPSGLSERARSVPGVRAATAVSIAYEAVPTNGESAVPLAGVDPREYSALSARMGLGAFPAENLMAPGGRHPKPGDALPAVASASIAEKFGTRGPVGLRLNDGTFLTLRITAVRDRTPAVLRSDFLLVDRAGLPAEDASPTALLLTGAHLDAGALRRAVGRTATVRTRAEARAGYADSPIQTGAEHVYTAAVGAASGLAVLALLLALVRAAPERAALLARLRTMGLTRAQGRRLLILESLPQALLGAIGGALTGWTVIRLLSPGVDLTVIALPATDGQAGQAALRPDLWSLAVPALTVVAVAVAVAGLQAWWTGRRGSVRELRAGDAR